MNRYNIETDNNDLIQIDLKDSWNLQNKEKALFTIIGFNYPKTNKCIIQVSRKDLETLRDKINQIL